MNRILILGVALGLLASGCGGGGGGDSAAESPAPTATAGGGGGTTLEVPADPEKLAFGVSGLEAPAGKVTLVMDNPSALSHDIAIKGNGVDVKGEVVLKGGTSTVTADLVPGTYTFYCSVPGHEEGGMKGTLTVTG